MNFSQQKKKKSIYYSTHGIPRLYLTHRPRARAASYDVVSSQSCRRRVFKTFNYSSHLPRSLLLTHDKIKNKMCIDIIQTLTNKRSLHASLYHCHPGRRVNSFHRRKTHSIIQHSSRFQYYKFTLTKFYLLIYYFYLIKFKPDLLPLTKKN